MPALADVDDYTLLIGPVPAEDEARLDAMLDVASSVVVTVAPKLYPYYEWPVDPDTGDPVDPGPVPPPAVYVTCQVASRYMADPSGGGGPVTMERVGLAQTHYDTSGWDATVGMLPPGWQITLKPWRMPDLESVLLTVAHPTEAQWYQPWWEVGVPE